MRIPLRHLVDKCDGVLYHSWLMLDSPGLDESVASIGMLETSSTHVGDVFSQADMCTHLGTDSPEAKPTSYMRLPGWNRRR